MQLQFAPHQPRNEPPTVGWEGAEPNRGHRTPKLNRGKLRESACRGIPTAKLPVGASRPRKCPTGPPGIPTNKIFTKQTAEYFPCSLNDCYFFNTTIRFIVHKLRYNILNTTKSPFWDGILRKKVLFYGRDV